MHLPAAEAIRLAEVGFSHFLSRTLDRIARHQLMISFPQRFRSPRLSTFAWCLAAFAASILLSVALLDYFVSRNGGRADQRLVAVVASFVILLAFDARRWIQSTKVDGGITRHNVLHLIRERTFTGLALVIVIL
jgi:hypothetical protein